MSLNQSAPLNLREEQRFSCTSCGKCCRTHWKIDVHSKVATQLRSTSTYQKRIRKGYSPLPLVDGKHQIGRLENGECVFFEDGGCDIHREAGLSAKPTTCQLYPFNLIKTPDGFFVSLSFSCPAAIAGVGTPLSGHREDLEALLDQRKFLPDAMPVLNQVSVSQEHKVSWEDYLELENSLVSNLKAEDPVAFLLNAACQLVSQARARDKIDVDKLDFSKSTLLLGDAASLLPIFATSCISTMEMNSLSDDREAFSEALKDRGGISRLLKIDLPPYQVHKPGDLITSQVILRYLDNIFKGKRLLGGPSVIAQLLLLACAVSILLYYLDAQSRSSELRHFSFEHLEWAFELIEVNIVTHSQDLDKFFSEYERALWAFSGITAAA